MRTLAAAFLPQEVGTPEVGKDPRFRADGQGRMPTSSYGHSGPFHTLCPRAGCVLPGRGPGPCAPEPLWSSSLLRARLTAGRGRAKLLPWVSPDEQVQL